MKQPVAAICASACFGANWYARPPASLNESVRGNLLLRLENKVLLAIMTSFQNKGVY
ncbi:hypothetical protein [Gimesia alba]|uniref:hypothetical protein n=1 Tax=Gimesia alba TaxID=2527973 RepID=UPI001E61E300|nr:hypothetical protein [Gimesia alba]